MKIELDIAFTAALSPEIHDAVASRLRPLLQASQTSGMFQLGDVLSVAGKRMRIVGRQWYLNSPETTMLELRLTVE